MSNTNHRTLPPPPPMGAGPSSLQCYKRAFVLLFFYIPLVVIPWVITMVLVYRPVTRSSWPYAEGLWKKDYQQMRGWPRAIPIMNAFAAVLAIPVTSAVIAQAAAVFAQRRAPGQKLSVRHLFGLADRPWLNWGLLHKMLGWQEKGGKGVKKFVFGGALLIVCGAIQYPLGQIVVSWEQISLPTCYGTSYMRDSPQNRRCDMDSNRHHVVGRDLEPAQMANLPAHLILPNIVDDLSRVQSRTVLPNIWRVPKEFDYLDPRFVEYLGEPSYGESFVAALPADTTTGVLSEHIMRMNSSVSCINLTMSDWPSTCSGASPFQASFDHDQPGYEGIATIDICAPGDSTKHPWSFSRNLQNLSEEVFFRFTSSEDKRFGNDVVHCMAQTTRGYFELGNTHNGERFGPLLEKWPSISQSHDFMEHEYSASNHDWSDKGYRPSEEDDYVGAAQPVPEKSGSEDGSSKAIVYTQLPGPLMTSVLALFGPYSWANSIANLTAGRSQKELYNERYNDTQGIPEGFLKPLCRAAPFTSTNLVSATRCTYNDGLYGLRYVMDDLYAGMEHESSAQKRLNIAMYVANLATLTSHLDDNRSPWNRETGRKIYTAEGLKAWKPHMTLAAQIILTLIVSVHVLGLLYVAWWIQRWPAWTRTLDSMAIARVAASLDTSLLPPIKTIGLSARKPLADVDGLIGIQRQAGNTEEPLQTQPARVTPAERAQQTDVEMETLSIASTAGKQATSFAVPTAARPADTSGVTFGVGAPGCIAKRGKKQVAPSAREVADV